MIKINKRFNDDYYSIFSKNIITNDNYNLECYDNHKKIVVMVSSLLTFNFDILDEVENNKRSNHKIEKLYLYKYNQNFERFNPELFINQFEDSELINLTNKLKGEIIIAYENSKFSKFELKNMYYYMNKLINMNSCEYFYKSLDIIFKSFYKNNIRIMNNIMNNDYSDFPNNIWKSNF